MLPLLADLRSWAPDENAFAGNTASFATADPAGTTGAPVSMGAMARDACALDTMGCGQITMGNCSHCGSSDMIATSSSSMDVLHASMCGQQSSVRDSPEARFDPLISGWMWQTSRPGLD